MPRSGSCRKQPIWTPTHLHLEQLATYGEPGRDPRGRIVSVANLAIAPGLPEPVAGTDAAAACWQPVAHALTGELQLAFDHWNILTGAVERARAKIEHSPMATAFCGDTFTISELQRVYEDVWGVELDPRNFYRKVQAVPGFLVPAGTRRRSAKGHPARCAFVTRRAGDTLDGHRQRTSTLRGGSRGM